MSADAARSGLVRDAAPEDLEPLSHLWHDGWTDAHAAIVPPALARMRTRAAFESRLRASIANVRVAGAVGRPTGFCMRKGNEIDQFYVSSSARGTGLARQLLIDAEDLLRSDGHVHAWLACAIGNLRAARFYEKHGWIRQGEREVGLAGRDGTPFPLVVWVYEKRLVDR